MDRDSSLTDQSSVAGTTAQLALPAEDFAFTSVFERAPDTRVTLESTATCLDDHALVNVTATVCDRNVIESGLRTDPAVTDVGCIAECREGWTYRLRWDGRARQLMQQLVAEDTMLLTARGQDNQWNLRILTPDRNTLSDVFETLKNLGYSVDCLSIAHYGGGDSARSVLTDEQQEALTMAYETGYYNIPQDITADELAEQLDISHQALSERLHRAYEQLVEDKFMIDDDHQN